jgi:hypothetical protein
LGGEPVDLHRVSQTEVPYKFYSSKYLGSILANIKTHDRDIVNEMYMDKNCPEKLYGIL